MDVEEPWYLCHQIWMLINFFSQGNPLPRRYGAFPPELVNMPLGDINIKWENKNYYSRLTKKATIQTVGIIFI